MEHKPLITIGDYAVPEPSSYSATTATIADTARNVKGVLIGSVVRDNVASVQMSWNFISTTDWANLLQKFIPAPNGTGAYVQPVTFFCQDTGDWQTRDMVVSDRQASVFKRDKAGSIVGYTEAALSLEEV